MILGAAAAATADRAEERRQLARTALWPLGVAGATLATAAAALALLAPGVSKRSSTTSAPPFRLSRGSLSGSARGCGTGGSWRSRWGWSAVAGPLVLLWGRAASIWPFSAALRPGEQARLCELLAVLVDARTPLPQALRAAGWTSPDKRLGRDVALTADSVEAGAEASAAAARRRFLPVPLRAALRRADDPDAFAAALRNAAAALRARVESRLGPAGLLAAVVQPALFLGLGGDRAADRHGAVRAAPRPVERPVMRNSLNAAAHVVPLLVSGGVGGV